MIVIVDNRVDRTKVIRERGRVGERQLKESMTRRLIDVVREAFPGHVNVVRTPEEAYHVTPVSAVILSGSSRRLSVGEIDAMTPARILLSRAVQDGVPILGICFGWQLLAWNFGGTVSARTDPFETSYHCDADGVGRVYAHHCDVVQVQDAPVPFRILHQRGGVVMTADLPALRIAGVQWHPEATEDGTTWMLTWLRSQTSFQSH